MNALSKAFSLNYSAAKKTSIAECFLTYKESELIDANLPVLEKRSEIEAWNQAKTCAEKIRKSISDDVFNNLQKLRKSEIPALVIRGFQLPKKLPPTPIDGRISLEKISGPLEILLGIFDIFDATPVGYAGENEDCFIRHVVPSKLALEEVSSHGSLMPLNSHIDNPHLPIGVESCEEESPAPNYIGWLGLRCELDVPTSVVLLEDVLAILPSAVIDSLKKPIFEIYRPPSFGAGATNQRLAPILVPDHTGKLCTRHGFAEPTNSEASHALSLFSIAANSSDLTHQVILRPGDLLLINNQKCMHGRDVFQPRYDGTDRWLLRFYGVQNWRPQWMSSHQLPYLVKG